MCKPVIEKLNMVELNTDELDIEATLENVDTVLLYVESRIKGCSAKSQNKIGIATDEIFSNIARYAYSPGVGRAKVRILIAEEITLEFEDTGKAYNPLEAKTPDITLTEDEREEGGLGIFMVKNIMDSVSYRRERGSNIVTLKTKL